LLLLLAGSLCSAAGCAVLPTLPWNKPRLDAEAGLYRSAAITYRIDAGGQSLPIAVARVEGQRVSYEQVASRPETGTALGTLSIRYPSPSGRADVAEVRLVIQRASSPQAVWWKPHTYLWKTPEPTADSIHEEWVLDIAKPEFDQILDQFRRDGFFVQSQPRAKAADVAVELNGRRVRKPWSQIAVLETTMQRVRREGQLVVLNRPATPAGATPLNTSVDAYRALVAQGGGGDTQLAGSLAVSGLMMPGGPNPGFPQINGEQFARAPGSPR
jgi:hypothetical protein